MDEVTVGDVTIRALSDTSTSFPPEAMFPEVGKDEWRPYQAYLMKDGTWPTNFGAFLLRVGTETILVDTGLGQEMATAFGAPDAKLLSELRSAGVEPWSVTTVVFTHLHVDHVGWSVTTKEGKSVPTFPRARYLVPKIDWDYFRQQPEDSSPHAAAVRKQVVPLETSADMQLVEDGHTVAPGVTLLATPGHTPGHLSVLFESRGEKGIVLGDVVASPVQFQEIEWKLSADTYHDVAQRTRRTVVERLVAEKRLVAVGHFPVPHNIGHVVEHGGRRKWEPKA